MINQSIEIRDIKNKINELTIVYEKNLLEQDIIAVKLIENKIDRLEKEYENKFKEIEDLITGE